MSIKNYFTNWFVIFVFIIKKMLRVISGKYRGKKLLSPPHQITRPMRDMVKEAVFSILEFTLPSSVILDAFAGSGSLAIEAVSRGAMKVICIENNHKAFSILQTNINNLKIRNIEIWNRNALDYIEKNVGLKFDIIFLDPPFKDYNVINKALLNIASSNFLQTNGYIVLQTDNPLKIILPSKLTIQKQKKYGINHILIITNNL